MRCGSAFTKIEKTAKDDGGAVDASDLGLTMADFDAFFSEEFSAGGEDSLSTLTGPVGKESAAGSHLDRGFSAWRLPYTWDPGRYVLACGLAQLSYPRLISTNLSSRFES